MDPTPEDVVRLLAEPVRMRVFAALTLSVQSPASRTAAAIAAVTGDSPRTVTAALNRLRAGGLVDYDQDAFTAKTDVFRDLARRTAAPPPEPTDFGTGDTATDAVLRQFVRGDRLTGFPGAYAKKRIVLEYIAAREFLPSAEYPETTVNERLELWCADAPIDHVSIRRYLIDTGILTREAGYYRLATDQFSEVFT